MPAQNVTSDNKIKSGSQVQLIFNGNLLGSKWDSGANGGSHKVSISKTGTYLLILRGTYVDPDTGEDAEWVSNTVTIVAIEPYSVRVNTTDFPEYCTQGDYRCRHPFPLANIRNMRFRVKPGMTNNSPE